MKNKYPYRYNFIRTIVLLLFVLILIFIYYPELLFGQKTSRLQSVVDSEFSQNSTPISPTPHVQSNESHEKDKLKSRYILSCNENDINYKIEIQNSNARIINSFIEQNTSAFKHSSNEDERLFYILYNTRLSENKRMSLLKQYVLSFPENSLAQWELLLECASQAEQCDNKTVMLATMAEPENASFWLLNAAIHQKKQDYQNTILALNNVLSLSELSEKVNDEINLFENIVSSTAIHFHPHTTLDEIGVFPKLSIEHLMSLLKFCGKKSNKLLKPDAIQLCLTTGSHMKEIGKSSFMKIMGITMMEMSYKALENHDQIGLLQKQKKYLFKLTSSQEFKNAMNLTLFDQQLLQDWYEAWKQQGEIYAQHYVIEEAIRLSKNPDYNPCPLH